MKHFACALSDNSVISITQNFGRKLESSQEVLDCAKILGVAFGTDEGSFLTGFSNSTHRNVIRSFYSWFNRCEAIVKEENVPADPFFVYTNLEAGITVVFKWTIGDVFCFDQPGSGITPKLKLALMSNMAKACGTEEMFPGSI